MLVLGIESSCDETAAAIVRDGREIVSSVISSQVDLHAPFGGVVPEIASREHVLKIDPIVDEALTQAQLSLKEIDGIAVTQGPGLIGSLLVGVSYAKSLAFALNKPFIGVNHIEGHVYSVVFENPPVEYPAFALIVSGGHTNLFLIPEEGSYKLLARTRDDAAGEAFDKVAKLLGLGYPGGPIIERLAREGNPRKVKFTQAKISDGKPDFSFSGLKSAVSRYVRENKIAPSDIGDEIPQKVKDLCAGFQATIVNSLIKTTSKLAKKLHPQTLIIAGGVACNEALRLEASRAFEELGIPVYFPSKHLSTDNAAMIAAAGTYRLRKGERSSFEMTADVSMRLQNIEIEDRRGKALRYRT